MFNINALIYVLLTVHLGIILDNDKRDAYLLCFTIYLLHSSICFELYAHHQEAELY